jgi:hypothetical protein
MKKTIAVLFALVVLASVSPSHAGYQFKSASCYRNSDGSGSCSGTLLGFRTLGTPNYYAEFFASTWLPAAFIGYTDTYYACTPNDAVKALWPMAMANQGEFYIAWDAHSTCTTLGLYNESSASNY